HELRNFRAANQVLFPRERPRALKKPGNPRAKAVMGKGVSSVDVLEEATVATDRHRSWVGGKPSLTNCRTSLAGERLPVTFIVTMGTTGGRSIWYRQGTDFWMDVTW